MANIQKKCIQIRKLSEEGKIDEAAIRNAVTKGWLTEEQANKILKPPEKQNH